MNDTDFPIQGAMIRYADVLDALSRGLLTQEEAATICRRIFLLTLPPSAEASRG